MTSKINTAKILTLYTYKWNMLDLVWGESLKNLFYLNSIIVEIKWYSF